MPIVGDTVKLKAEFSAWDGTHADPTDVVVRVYDPNRKLLSVLNVAQEHRISAGIFEIPYILPYEGGVMFPFISYEFTGNLEGFPITGRKRLDLEWST